MKSGFRKIFGPTSERGEDQEGLALLESPTGEVVVDDGASHVMQDGPVPGINGRQNGKDKDLPRVRDRVVESLLNQDLVTSGQVQEARSLWHRRGGKETLWRVLAQHPAVNTAVVYAEAARIYAFRTAEITPTKPEPDFVKRVVESFQGEQQEKLFLQRLLPLEQDIDTDRGLVRLVFATPDPTRPETLRLMHDLGLEHFELRYAPESAIVPLLEELFPRQNEFLRRIADDELANAYDLGTSYEAAKSQLVDEDALEAEINRSSLINLFEGALLEAVRMGASDIHIFPNEKKQTEFHFRVDGELDLWKTQDKVHPEAMLAVIKDRCGNVDRFEREAAQDGFVQRTVDGTLIRYRVSVLPIATSSRDVKAESIVIRVLDDRKVFGDLSAIGLLPGALERFQKAIHQPYGMVIMTGPTGSGKSTTLVAALQQVVSPKVNVLTVEDPVEYIIRGVRQIKLGTRLELEQALRAILRHDPDVVMVGEMRDKPTAELAIKLANTGHLTFSTLHTNDAPSAISRLYKMGIEPFLIAYAINLVVAQRLIRKICPECREVDHDPDHILLRQLGFTEQELEGLTLYRPGSRQGCRTCKGQGYKGRRAISEALYFSREIRHLIVESDGTIDEDAIRNQAVKEGMLTLLASAREVVKMGQTTLEEVVRVVTSE